MTKNETKQDLCNFCGLEMPTATNKRGPRPLMHKGCVTASNDLSRLISSLEAIPAMTTPRRQQLETALMRLNNGTVKRLDK